MQPIPIAFPGLTFFLPSLQMLQEVECPPEATASPEQRLAWHLLALGGHGPGRASLAAGLVSTHHRLNRARVLLRDALAHERRGEARAAADTWAWVDREWTALADSKSAERLLARQARSLGMEPDVAWKVFSAVETELLPALHLRCVLFPLAARLTTRRHVRFIEGWSLPSVGVSAGLARLYAAYLLAKTLVTPPGKVDCPNLYSRFELLFKAVPRDPVVEDLFEEVLRHFLAWAEEGGARSLRGVRLDDHVSSMQQLGSSSPPSLRKLELESRLLTEWAFRQLSRPIPTSRGVLQLRLATTLDPYNKKAQRLFEEVLAISSAEGGTGPGPSWLVPSAHLQAHRAGLREGLASVEHVVDTELLQHAAARFKQGLYRELMRRLELDPSRTEHHALNVALIDSINDAMAKSAQDRSAPELRGAIRTQVFARSPLAPWLPWDQIDATLERNSVPVGQLLGRLLPPTAPEAIRQRLVSVRQTVHSSSGVAVPAGQLTPFRVRMWTWLGSTRDLMFKLAAVAGMVMLVHSVGWRAPQWLDVWMRDRAYRALHAGASGGDRRRVIESAEAFLLRDGSEERDPRLDEVKARYADAVLNEVLRLARAGHEEEANRLLGQYEWMTGWRPVPALDEVLDEEEVAP